MSWGAIFAGTVTALAVWAMLYAFGLALGLSNVNPNDPGSMRGAGIFTGIWSVLSPLIALFVGGVVAGRGAGLLHRRGGALHGLVMWGVTVLLGAWLITSLLTGILGTVASVGQSALQAGVGAVSGAAGGGVAGSLGIDANDALAPINERLRAEGRPPITAAGVEAASRDVIQEAVRTGQINRELLVSNIAQNTALSRQDAEQIASRLEAQLSAGGAQVGQTLQTGALKAADATGKALWGVFAALFLGMISAVLGAVVGTGGSRKERHKEQVVEVAPPGGPLTDRREVYP